MEGYTMTQNQIDMIFKLLSSNNELTTDTRDKVIELHTEVKNVKEDNKIMIEENFKTQKRCADRFEKESKRITEAHQRIDKLSEEINKALTNSHRANKLSWWVLATFTTFNLSVITTLIIKFGG